MIALVFLISLEEHYSGRDGDGVFVMYDNDNMILDWRP